MKDILKNIIENEKYFEKKLYPQQINKNGRLNAKFVNAKLAKIEDKDEKQLMRAYYGTVRKMLNQNKNETCGAGLIYQKIFYMKGYENAFKKSE